MPDTLLPRRPSAQARQRSSPLHRRCGEALHPLALWIGLACVWGSSAGLAAAVEAPAARATAVAEPGLPAELDALDLADQASQTEVPKADESSRSWRAFVEAAAGRNALGGGVPDVNTRRLSADLRYDQRWTPALRAVLSNRLDLADSDAQPPAENVNTLREAYLSWTPAPSSVLDLGRVNIPLGSAMGYNPTDWFKSGALRSVVSPDPAVLRENRQGTVVLRAQHLWDGGSLTGLVSPKLATSPDTGRYALDAGSTNPRHRWLLAGSHRLSDRVSPQVLLQGGEGQSTQLGLNLSALAGEATTAYAEWAGGRGASWVDQARAGAGSTAGVNSRRFHTRWALGVTHTTALNLMLTLEAQRNGAAPTRSEWQSLSAAERLTLLSLAQREQDLPGRQAWFVHARWQDVFMPRVDLAGYWRRDTQTGGTEHWLELRYRAQGWEAALQWQALEQEPGNAPGTGFDLRALELALRLYF